jgi:hypothetical protein
MHHNRAVYKQLLNDFSDNPELIQALWYDYTKIRSQTAAQHNRAMHSANGNISGLAGIESVYQPAGMKLEIAGEIKTAANPDLAGAIPVLGPSLYSMTPTAPTRVSVTTFDSTMLHHRVGLSGDPLDRQTLTGSTGCMSAPNEFIRHFPYLSGRLAERRYDSTLVRVAGSANDLDYTQTTAMPPRPNDMTGGAADLRYPELSCLWQNDEVPEALRKAETIMSTCRFTGQRGNRQIFGWEAQGMARVSALRAMANIDSEGNSYFRFFYRLWTLYFCDALSTASETNWSPNGRSTLTIQAPVNANQLPFNPLGGHVASRIRLIPITSRMPAQVAAQPYSPEEPLMGEGVWADNISNIAAGHVHIIDVENMTDQEIQLAVFALAPKELWHRLCYTVNKPSNDPTAPTPNTVFYPVVDTYYENRDAAPTTFFLHYGNRPIPSFGGATSVEVVENRLLGRAGGGLPANIANSPWARSFNKNLLQRVITMFVRKQRAGQDAWNAFDAVLYRFGGYKPSDLPSARPNAQRHIISAFGSEAVCLPPDNTSTSYFDVFRSPHSMDIHAPDVNDILHATPSAICWTGFYATHALACAINWPGYTLSMRNEEWTEVNRPAGNASPYMKNLCDTMTKVLYRTEITPWAMFHRRAIAMMYGFQPAISTVLTTDMIVKPIYKNNCAPWLANPYHSMWMLKLIPNHMVLPCFNEVPSWPKSAPQPMISTTETGTPKVRLARNLELFTGRAWVQDSGMMQNAQFYAAAPHGANVWRSDIGVGTEPNISFGFWNSPFEYEVPSNPVYSAPIWLGGFGSLWGNAILPGSLQNYSTQANRIRAMCVSLDTVDWTTTKAWTDMTIGQNVSGVTIEYVTPANFKVELPPVNDFSTLIWADVDTGYYRTMSLESTGSTLAVALEAPSHFSGFMSTFPTELANHNRPELPSSLANHNSPHAPQPDGRLAQLGRRQRNSVGFAASKDGTVHKPKFTPSGRFMKAAKVAAAERALENAEALKIKQESKAKVAAATTQAVDSLESRQPAVAIAAPVIPTVTRPKSVGNHNSAQPAHAKRQGARFTNPNINNLAEKPSLAQIVAQPTTTPAPVHNYRSPYVVNRPKGMKDWSTEKKTYVHAQVKDLAEEYTATGTIDALNALNMSMVNISDAYDKAFNEKILPATAVGRVIANPQRIPVVIPTNAEMNDGAAAEVQEKWTTAPEQAYRRQPVQSVQPVIHKNSGGLTPDGQGTLLASDDWEDYDDVGEQQHALN